MDSRRESFAVPVRKGRITCFEMYPTHEIAIAYYSGTQFSVQGEA